MLAEIRTVGDAKRVVDMAEAARVYARKAQLGLAAQNHAGEIKLRAERKAGELLGRMEKNRGERGRRIRLASVPPYSSAPVPSRW